MSKKNLDVHFSSKSDVHGTPQHLYDYLHYIYSFTLDVCANPENAKCDKYFTEEMDGLKQIWTGRCWMNPPYSKLKLWIAKAFHSVADGDAELVVALIPSRTDTEAFQRYIFPYTVMGDRMSGILPPTYKREVQNVDCDVSFIKGRLKFQGQKDCAPFPSAVICWRNNGRRKDFLLV